MRFQLTLLLAIASSLPASAATLEVSQLKPDEVKQGTAVASDGPDFLFAIESASQPSLFVDGEPVGPMHRSGSLWTWAGKLKTGRSHAFYYIVDGQRKGGKTDVAAYGPDSYAQPGVPQGKLSEKMEHTSKIYEGMKSDYWIYVPARYDPNQAAALMIWQDGQGLIERDGSTRAQIVFDNLTQQKKIPG